MSTNEVESKDKMYQVYLGSEVSSAFERYIRDKYPPKTRVQTALIRRALAEFLKREGYYDGAPGD